MGADFDRDAARARFTELVQGLAREVKLDPALDLMTDTFIRSRAASNRYAVRDASKAIKPADAFVLQQRSPFRIAEDGDNIVVIGPGGESTFAANERPALERALNGQPFKLADLNTDKAEAMIATLFAYGLIVRE